MTTATGNFSSKKRPIVAGGLVALTFHTGKTWLMVDVVTSGPLDAFHSKKIDPEIAVIVVGIPVKMRMWRFQTVIPLVKQTSYGTIRQWMARSAFYWTGSA